ncbi:DUF1631 family protein [Hahella aquimaris]|uniref:DUF1631 family protein n=1 Tax=Hahella sp. HNIBRBA332 TaxID=3015983 RepID=UPI00273C2493|nr:DUF1631 family protein [Hahella sp. HNIBRBA332]WLQ12258.1 DUF1631 family protein [Hahella sp. HNIBRBA332]
MQNNKRQHPRYSLQHEALIVAKGFTPASCGVANICAGGMLLSDIDSEKLTHHLREKPDCRVEVHIFCQYNGSEHHLRLLADTRRVEGRKVGIEFLQSQPQLVEMMLKIRQSASNMPSYTTRSKRQKLKEWFENAAERLIGNLLESFFANIETELNTRIASSAVLRDINAFRDAKVLFTQGRKKFKKDFIEHWHQELDLLFGARPMGEWTSSELELVDKTQFEDWLEVQMVATAVANRQRTRLFMLNQMLSQVSGKDIDDRWNPIGPAVLCQCLHYAVNSLQTPDPAKPVLYLAFERLLTRELGESTDEFIDMFKSHGLKAVPLDQMRTNWSEGRAKPRSPAPKVIEGAASDLESLDFSLDTPAASAPLHPQMRAPRGSILSLVRMQRGGYAPSRGVSEPGADYEYGATQLLQDLQQNQRELLGSLAQQDGTIREVVEIMAEGGRVHMPSDSQEVWDRVDLVDRIFAPLSSRNMPTELKGLINQLRMPLLFLLLKDSSFLDDSRHPARSVLNHFMALASADRVSSKSLEKVLNEVIDELSAGRLDAALLESVSSRLEQLVERQQRAFVRNAERIAKTCEGRDRLKRARKAVSRRISTLLAGAQVADVVLELLAAGWENFMVLALLKEGGDSDSVADYFAVIEQLHDWLGKDNDSEDLAFERELEGPAMLDLIEKELASSPDPQKASAVCKKLRAIFADDLAVTYTLVATYPTDEEADETGAESDFELAERWQERAHQLQVGDWVEMCEADTTQRMRLVWVGEDAYKFVFLTPQGLHEVHLDYSDLVTKMDRGQLARVQEGEVPFVDQSLYSIVQDLYHKMAIQAVHDPLTGCMHRHEFEKQLQYLATWVKNHDETAALIVFDIDQFGAINSNYGNAIGDRLLRDFSLLVDSWLDELRIELKLGRIGGNEFALLVSPASQDVALDAAERVCKQFSKHRFEAGEGHFSATLSVGVVMINGGSTDASALLNHASLACRSAKRAGGSRVKLFLEEDRDQAFQQEVLHWVSRIDQAIDDCDLWLRAQRIQSMDKSSDEHFYEILLGLNDQNGKPISPAAFIEAGERYKRSIYIDRWVVDNVLSWMRANPAKLENMGGFTINLSGHSLSDDGFLEFLEGHFRKGGFPAQKVCFEITETAAVASLHYTADFIRELKRTGCRFALDDFGTGFSSYAYLQSLPVDFLKIDGVFVRDIHENMTNYAMVRSINELGRFMGMATIAECVESVEVLEALSEIGVDWVQGYIVGKPVPLLDL